MFNKSNPSSSKPPGDPFLAKLMFIFAWLVIMVFLGWFFYRWLEVQRNPNIDVEVLSQSGEAPTIRLERNRYGHYVMTGSINGQPATFMLDTGATVVSIPGNVAKQLKLKRGPVGFAHTAGGTIKVYATRLDKISLGPITLRNVRASINPSMRGDQILLGMSALKKLEFRQKGKMLIIKQHY